MGSITKICISLFVFVLIPYIANAKTTINGAGATFPYPLYLKMMEIYKKETGVEVNYQPIGSGGGIRNIISGIVDFAGSDAVMSPKEEKEAKATILHIPTVVGSVVLSYNLPDVKDLVLDGEIIEKIYMGTITNWNDKAIHNLNPKATLPNLKITPVYRADGSGTTFIFTEYLSKVSEEWKELYGADKSIAWATGVGQKGNAGVAGFIKANKGAIGYIEVGYAEQSKLPFASIKNASGVLITSKNILVATSKASALQDMPDHLKVSLTNSSVKDASPIASFTWVLLRKEQNYNNRTLQQAKATKEFVKWMITKGQIYAEPLLYAPLSFLAQKKALELLDTLTYNGKPL